MSYTYEREQLSLLEKGEYEVFIEDASLKVLDSGKEKILVTFKVRSDVEQSFKGRKVWDNIWKEKENPEFFDRKKINRLLGTQDIKEGKVFDEIQDVLRELNGARLIIRVDKQFNDYTGKEENRVVGFKTTKFPLEIVGGKPVEISEDELPF